MAHDHAPFGKRVDMRRLRVTPAGDANAPDICIVRDDEKDIVEILNRIPDPTGTFYRYSLPASLLRRRKLETVDG